ncbi:probable G-protein coupled receptor 34 [Electrophorus electricus]|uniref:Probable G-protein coupled receptor 34 n=1 Tax=Electrophorus electricus TaxID=8005 RepID=A0A4W4H886_ELEEL|nr:probable G-protein coupled receptor 34 [Electrophorus electricus]XP_026874232.1 probable G-protein coupled receptor 34 [Electrophorus electricus]
MSILNSTTAVPNISNLLPTTSALNQSCSPEDEFLSVPFAVFYSVLFLFGLVGNLLALWVFLFLHSRRNSVRVFLINVALADLVLVACLPFRVLYHALGNHWPLGPHMCKLVGNLFYMNMYVSITLLGLISLDRYLKTQWVQGGRGSCGRRWLRSSRWSVVSCGVLWAISLMAVVPMITLAEGNEEQGKCFQYKPRTEARSKAYFNLFLVGIFWLVFVVLLVTYGRIACNLLKASRDRPDLPNAMRYARTAKKSFVVLFLFTVCFVPYHSFRGVYVRSQLSDPPCEVRRFVDRINEVMLLFSALNSCLDPVMYFLLSGSVRKATIQTVSHVFCARTDTTVTTGSSTTEFHKTSQSSTYALATPRGSVGLIPSLHLKTSLEVVPCAQRPGLCDYEG